MESFILDEEDFTFDEIVPDDQEAFIEHYRPETRVVLHDVRDNRGQVAATKMGKRYTEELDTHVNHFRQQHGHYPTRKDFDKIMSKVREKSISEFTKDVYSQMQDDDNIEDFIYELATKKKKRDMCEKDLGNCLKRSHMFTVSLTERMVFAKERVCKGIQTHIDGYDPTRNDQLKGAMALVTTKVPMPYNPYDVRWNKLTAETALEHTTSLTYRRSVIESKITAKQRERIMLDDDPEDLSTMLLEEQIAEDNTVYYPEMPSTKGYKFLDSDDEHLFRKGVRPPTYGMITQYALTGTSVVPVLLLDAN